MTHGHNEKARPGKIELLDSGCGAKALNAPLEKILVLIKSRPKANYFHAVDAVDVVNVRSDRLQEKRGWVNSKHASLRRGEDMTMLVCISRGDEIVEQEN